MYHNMWYVNPNYSSRKSSTSTSTAYGDMRHMNVVAAWKRGYSGKGVVVTILDDGIEKDHPDLMANYDSAASYDINDNDSDPQPRYNPANENRLAISIINGEKTLDFVCPNFENNLSVKKNWSQEADKT